MKSHPFLDSLLRMRTELVLAPLKEAMNELNNPEKKLKCIQIAGTNGKGSTAAMIANGLSKAGLYTSPHLYELNERIQIDGVNISDEELNQYINKVKPIAEKYELSFFEALTAVAYLYFFEKNCEYAVMEVGLGGRLDATSVCVPLISVITTIDLDHMHILGDTIEKIAVEKAAIIKGNIAITSVKKPSALNIIKEKAAMECATLIEVQQKNFALVLKGDYQQNNAACAYEALRALGKSDEDAKEAVESTRWLGRLDRRGRFLFDCAHNPSAMHTLANYLSGKEFELVIAMKDDKNYEETVSIIAPLAKKVFVTQYSVAPQSLDAATLYEATKKFNSESELVWNAHDAITQTEGFTVITGSLFLVSELSEDLN